MINKSLSGKRHNDIAVKLYTSHYLGSLRLSPVRVSSGTKEQRVCLRTLAPGAVATATSTLYAQMRTKKSCTLYKMHDLMNSTFLMPPLYLRTHLPKKGFLYFAISVLASGIPLAFFRYFIPLPIFSFTPRPWVYIIPNI